MSLTSPKKRSQGNKKKFLTPKVICARMSQRRNDPAPEKEKKIMTSRKTRVTYTDVSMAYLLGGVAQVGKLLADHSDPVGTLDKAINAISAGDASRDISDLERLRDKFSASRGTGSRGAKSLGDSGRKVYSAQQVGEGDLFIRLPVSLLVNAKGAGVKVEVDGDRLVVTRA